ncbi:hypothetical protein SAMN05444483_101196 [Salegentibacter echinorum]|uniref:Uncharacterized protein n=1 Tax=Salegentibacter echinorum TaxID=1073325 RepID=A0A1M5BU87_SALEC|nr:hypothetical protein [Salegentibacter echinorum]SHF46068.1 hypothetical protein SAMN05444483_101196 [Salegentibacter echinorum]
MTSEISVPIQLFIDAQQKGYAKKLQFFLSLKLLYNCGKTKLDEEELLFLELTEEISSRKTTLKYIEFLLEKGWLTYNAKTGYYIIKSFERIRSENNWEVRLSFPVDFNSYQNIKAITGAIIYGYLHKDFWRKVRRKKSVQIKGSTYHFLSPHFNYKEAPAPLSVLGIGSIFQISAATASRLKNCALKQKLLKVNKNYGAMIPNKMALELCLGYNDKPNNIVFVQGSYRFQLIDTILPLFLFKRRKKLKT